MSKTSCSADGPVCPNCRELFVIDEVFYFNEYGYQLTCDCGAKFEVQPQATWSWASRIVEETPEVTLSD